jgi:carboxylesterase type B
MQMPHLKTASSQLLRAVESDHVSEDCLYMSIYVPLRGSSNLTTLSTEQILSRNDNRPLPVLVWFAGEGYDFADARQFDGSALAASTNSIVVTVQYRVGVFGFLRVDGLNDGNQALWDQVTALQWLQTHLPAFGGNTHAVTVAGRFTGSMSLSILLTSPFLANRRLFDRAVLISGVAAGDWVFDSRPVERLHSLAQQVACDVTNATHLIECLQQLSANRLLATAGFGWKPVYDGRLVVGQPISLLESGLFAANVTDVLIGSTEHDGSLCYQTQQAIRSSAAVAIDSARLTRDSYLQLVHQDLEMVFDGQSSSVSRLFQMMQNAKYSPNEDYSERYIRFCTQLLTRSHQDRFAQLLRDRTQVSTYRLVSKPSVSSSPTCLQKAGFGDDVLLAFGRWSSAADRQLAANFRSMLGSFVQNGIGALHANRLAASDSDIQLISASTVLESPSSASNSDITPDNDSRAVSNSSSSTIDSERASSPLDSLRSHLHNPPAFSAFSCHSATSGSNGSTRPTHSLLTRLFEHAARRNLSSHIACAHINSKTDFLRLMDQSVLPTLLPLHSS